MKWSRFLPGPAGHTVSPATRVVGGTRRGMREIVRVHRTSVANMIFFEQCDFAVMSEASIAESLSSALVVAHLLSCVLFCPLISPLPLLSLDPLRPRDMRRRFRPGLSHRRRPAPEEAARRCKRLGCRFALYRQEHAQASMTALPWHWLVGSGRGLCKIRPACPLVLTTAARTWTLSAEKKRTKHMRSKSH